MSVKKREGKKRVYWDVFFYGGIDPDTEKKIEVTKRGFHTKREAEAYEAKLLLLHQEGKLAQFLDKTTVAELYKLWDEEHLSEQVRENTVASWRVHIENDIIPAFGHVPIRKLTPLRIQQWVTKLMDPESGRGRGGNGLAHGSGQLVRILLSMMLKWAVKMEMLDRNPAQYVTVPGEDEFTPVVVTPDMATTILSVLEGSQWYEITFTAFYTGLRRSELGGLRWSRVDLDNGWLAVEETRVYIGSKWKVGKPKSTSSRRTIALSENLVRFLRDWLCRQREIYRKAGKTWSEEVYVFCDPKGVELNLLTLTNSFKKILRRADIYGIRFHDTRHAHATALFLRYVHPKIIQEILGHSTLQMTLDTYSHLIPEQHQFAAAEIDRAMEMGPGEWVHVRSGFGQKGKIQPNQGVL